MGKDDQPYFKALGPSNTTPNRALHTYLANKCEYPTLWSYMAKSSQSTNRPVVCLYSANVSFFLSAFFSMSLLMRVKEQITWIIGRD